MDKEKMGRLIDLLTAAATRALRTFGQIFLTLLTPMLVGKAVIFSDVLVMSAIAALMSLCNSVLTGLPEAVRHIGTIFISEDGEINVNIAPESGRILENGETVTLTVEK